MTHLTFREAEFNCGFGEPRPSDITPEALTAARGMLATVCEIDRAEVGDSRELAERLLGVAWAVSSIACVGGSYSALADYYDKSDAVVLQSFELLEDDFAPVNKKDKETERTDEVDEERKEPETYRMLTASSNTGHGAAISTATLKLDSEIDCRPLQSVTIPTDEQIRCFLEQGSLPQSTPEVSSTDLRGYQELVASPFSETSREPYSLDEYLATLQQLTTELLNVTEV